MFHGLGEGISPPLPLDPFPLLLPALEPFELFELEPLALPPDHVKQKNQFSIRILVYLVKDDSG